MYSIFVSSTFKDMQFERDYIKNVLTPRFNTFLAPYGESVNFGDLRWGVNTSGLDEEEANKKVLKICLDEIDSDRRYIIVFIGDRYGWIPPSDLMRETMDNKDIHDLDVDISVTNLEIEYGVFSSQKATPLFFFRKLDTSRMTKSEKAIYEAESEIHKAKLEALKHKIIDKYGDVVFEYTPNWDSENKVITGLEEVMDILYSKLSKNLEKELEEYKTLKNYQKAIRTSKAYFDSLADGTYRRSDKSYKIPVPKEYKDYYHSNYEDLPIYCYPTSSYEGTGKKTYIAKLYQESLSDDNYISVPFAFGINEYTDSSGELADFILQVIKEAIGEETSLEREEDLLDKLLTVLPKLEKSDKRIRFFILNASHDQVSLIKLLEAYREITHITFIVQDEFASILEGTNIPRPFYNHNIYFDIDRLNSTDDKVGMIKAICQKKHKELSPKVIEEILRKKNSDLPLYLSLIVERLLYLNKDDFKKIRNLGDGMEAIETYMCKVVQKSKDDIKGIAKELLKDLVEKINKEMLLPFIRLMTYDFRLSVYPTGDEQESEIEQLYKSMNLTWNKIDYLLFIHSIPSLFLQSSLNDGYLKFKTRAIKEAAIELCDKNKVPELFTNAIEFINQSDRYNKVEKIMLALDIYAEYEDVNHFADTFIKYFEYEKNHRFSKEFPKVIKLVDEKAKKGNRFFFDVMRRLIEIYSKKKGTEYISNYVGYFFIPFAHRSLIEGANKFSDSHFMEILTAAYIAYKEHPKNKYVKGIVALFVLFMKDKVSYEDEDDIMEIIENDIEENSLMEEFQDLYTEMHDACSGPFNFFVNAYNAFGAEFGEKVLYGSNDDICDYLQECGDQAISDFNELIFNQSLLKDALNPAIKPEDVKNYCQGQLTLIAAMRFFLEYYFGGNDVERYFDIFNRLLYLYLKKYSFTNEIGGVIDEIEDLRQIGYFLCGLKDFDLSGYPFIKERLKDTITLFTEVVRSYLAVRDDDIFLLESYAQLAGDIAENKNKEFLYLTPLFINSFLTGYHSGLACNYFALLDAVHDDLFPDKESFEDQVESLFIEMFINLDSYYSEVVGDPEGSYYNFTDMVRKYLVFASRYRELDEDIKKCKKKDPMTKKLYDRIASTVWEISYKEFLEDIGD